MGTDIRMRERPKRNKSDVFPHDRYYSIKKSNDCQHETRCSSKPATSIHCIYINYSFLIFLVFRISTSSSWNLHYCYRFVRYRSYHNRSFCSHRRNVENKNRLVTLNSSNFAIVNLRILFIKDFTK